MNQQRINNTLDKLNKLFNDIYQLKNEIEEYKNSNTLKRKRNEEQFNKVYSDLLNKENQIKALMENKHFSFIEHVDFINNDHISQLTGFNIENKNGCLVKNIDEKTTNEHIDKIYNNTFTEITYEFQEGIISNELEYSFYNSSSGLPILPSEIKINYGEYEEDFYEPNFRYFNRYITNTFVNNFLFNAKKIKKIKFKFLEPINVSNDKCVLYTNKYNTEDTYANLFFSNPKQISIFNFSKRSDESVIPLIFEFSEDNTNFTKIEFNSFNEGIIQLKNKENFYVRITSDYNNFIVKEEKIVNEQTYKKSDITSDNIKYSINVNGAITNANVIFPYSTYKALLEEFKNIELDINDFIEKKHDVYYINNSFIKYVKEPNADIDKLKFFDDISILKEDEKFFNFYFNTSDNSIYFSPFLNKYELYFKINYETLKEQIPKELYTPFVFDVSVKG